MATAKVKTSKKKVKNVTYEVQEVNTIELQLSEVEATTLRTILRNVGGPITGLRKHVDAITQALTKIGITFYDSDVFETRYYVPPSNQIYFK